MGSRAGTEGRVAGTEVVDRQVYTQRLDLTQAVVHPAAGVEHGAFSHFQRQAARVEARGPEYLPHVIDKRIVV